MYNAYFIQIDFKFLNNLIQKILSKFVIICQGRICLFTTITTVNWLNYRLFADQIMDVNKLERALL